MKKCVYPQNILIIGTDGYTDSCPLETANLKLENINDGILNAWNSSKYTDFRNNLDAYLIDKEKICWQCNKLEQNGAVSLRTETPLLSKLPELKAVQFKLSNRCQLVCAHCGPYLSSSWGKFVGSKDYIKQFELKDHVIDELAELLPNLNYIRFTGGEPWMDPMHWKILKRLSTVDKKNCELHYITNGLSTVRKDLWQGWKKVKIMLSVDGYEDSYEWFRRNAKWNDLVNAYNILKTIPNVEIKINYSLTPWTINYLESASAFFKEPMLVVPIMSPYHCSLGSLSRDDFERLGLTYYEKYNNVVNSNPKPLTYLKTWATDWDKKWGTQGLAEKIHPWLKLIN